MPKIIKYTHLVRSAANSKFLAIYGDGTWEELFTFNQYRVKVDGKLFLRKTREEALIIARNILSKESATET